MKHMRKILALALALMLVLGLATTASADDGYTITIKGETGHQYEVYQIFSGDLHDDVLSNIDWGNGVSDAGQTALGNAAAKAESLTSDNIDEFEAAVDDYLTNPKTMTEADGTYTLSNLAAGYYLIKDKDNSQEGDNGTYTAYILKVVNDVTTEPKDSVPSVDKSVTEGGKNADDFNIGDTVTFILTATLGDNLNQYNTYNVIFHDTMANSLTFKEYVSATLDGKDVKNNFTMNQKDQALTFTCNDVKALGAKDGSEIVITYTATLNNTAEIGQPGNENKVYLEYSNNPNVGGTGNTPEDKVLVFTYELDVTKIDGTDNNKKLESAEFKLQNAENNKWVTVDTDGKVTGWVDNEANGSVLTSDANGLFKVIGLDAGNYSLKETKAPAGYNLLDKPIAIEIAATLNTAEDQAALNELTIKVDNGTAENGALDTGIVGTNVENKAGTTLPETGGIGTTIFYVVGGLLVLAAIVLLVTKKRMASAK